MTPPKKRNDDRALSIWRLLRENGPMTARELTKATGAYPGMFTSMRERGHITRSDAYVPQQGYTYTATDLPAIHKGPLDLWVWQKSWGPDTILAYSEDTDVGLRTARIRCAALMKIGMLMKLEAHKYKAVGDETDD